MILATRDCDGHAASDVSTNEDDVTVFDEEVVCGEIGVVIFFNGVVSVRVGPGPLLKKALFSVQYRIYLPLDVFSSESILPYTIRGNDIWHPWQIYKLVNYVS